MLHVLLWQNARTKHGQSGAIAAVLIGVLVTSDAYSIPVRDRATVLPKDVSHEPPWRSPAGRAEDSIGPDRSCLLIGRGVRLIG